jgi:chorismate mutase-like protein
MGWAAMTCRRALKVRVLAVGVGAALACAAATGQPPRLQKLPVPGVLRVGTTGDYPPFSFRDARTGRYVGSDVEAAERLAARLGLRLALVPTTWQTLLADQAAGRFDLAMGGISITPERAAQAAFSVPYLRDGKTALARCADQWRFQRLAQIDRPEVRLIENPGGTNERFARLRLPQATLRVHPDNVSVFDEILARRADVMITDAVEARLQQQLRPGLCAVHPARPFDPAEKAYLLPRDPAVKGAVDRWLRAELASRRSQRRLEHWLKYPWPMGPGPVVTLARLIDERLALMPEVARYKWNRHQAIEDLPREQALLESVRAQSVRYGLAPERATAFFAAQIEASKVIQRELFARWQAEGQGPFETVTDLAGAIRPRLDALNPRLLAALAAVEGAVTRRSLGALEATAISPDAVDVAVAPLLHQ